MRKYLFALFTSLLVQYTFAQTDTAQLTTTDTPTVETADTSYTFINQINKLLQLAEKQQGTPYHYGGCKPGGFDCSGFVQYCYAQALGINLPHSSGGISSQGIKVSTQNTHPGDIIYFTGRSVNGRTGHIGIVYEVTPSAIYFIHASSSQGVRINKTNDTYWDKRFLGIKRILK